MPQAILPAVLIATSVAGVGLSAVGMLQQTKAAKQQAAAQTAITQKEQEAEAVRKRATELDARRRQLEIVRNQQRARSLSLTSASAQNAQQGSGLPGGYGQISGDTGTNLLGVTQNLQLGREIFDINAAISQQRIKLSQAGSSFATGSAVSSFGGVLLKNLGNISRLSGAFGSSVYPQSYGSAQTYGEFVRGLGRTGRF